ncbi:ABC transporter substrate-binding protein [Clostridia bacterium]|nr:ABC transporter substrate-binding protein [Clostridia bacterium]
MKACVAFVICVLVFAFCGHVYAADNTEERESLLSYLDLAGANGEVSYYADYSENYRAFAEDTVFIDTADAKSDSNSVLTYRFSVNYEGLYNIRLNYKPYGASSAEIQRAVLIDGVLPYKELAVVSLGRVFAFSGTWEQDNRGNDLKPRSYELSDWNDVFLYDDEGYYNAPLSVFLTKGEHTITLVSLREEMILGGITLAAASVTLPYEENEDIQPSFGQSIVIEGENAARVSAQTLYPIADTSSPAVSPSSPKLLLNNSIGGETWNQAGQWIEWDFYAPEGGYYEVDVNVRQNFKRGMLATRVITIDGEIPFAEAGNYSFGYKQGWYVETLSDSNGAPFKFYLEKGNHTIRLQAALGDYAEIITLVRRAVVAVNGVYGKVIRLTGTAPDPYRDYQIERNLPELTEEIEFAADMLDKAIDLAYRLGGNQGERGRVLVTLRDQLMSYAKEVDRISRNIDEFKTNISACGTWVNEAVDQPLQIDRFLVRPSGTEKLNTKSGFFANLIFELQRLFYSYIIDYTQVGNVAEDNGEALTVWIGSGRDQAGVVKQLIEEDFTSETGIAVNLQLVDLGTLLQAVMAGQGPDAAFQVGEVTTSLTYGQRYGQMSGEMPVNYGLRGAVLDLRQFADFEQIRARFAESAMISNEFGGKTYALPETQSFPVMFYRKDILTELGLSLPDTWSDAEKTIAVLARSQMTLGLSPGEQLFATFLYQHGGEYYNESMSASALNSPQAIEAFKAYCEYFTDYKLDKEIAAAGATSGSGMSQRFRLGEAPIIIADFGLYNELQISAPDLRGLWGMAVVPGVTREDGTIDRSVAAGGNSCVILSGTKQADAAWELLKWWTGTEAQTRYGKLMEGLLGAAARVATANLEAFAALPWPVNDYNVITAQREYAKGIPQAPGGYITYRNVNNAFFLATTGATAVAGSLSKGNVLMNPEEALTDKVTLIDDEIKYKRAEFGLD